jgi:hypothetical protein
MRCEEVRPLLPDLAEGVPRPVGPAQVHLSSCPQCAEELARYRWVLLELAAIRENVTEPPEGFLEALLAGLPEVQRRRLLARVAADERVQHAAFSLGGAVVGATAIGFIWWRAARRGVRV